MSIEILTPVIIDAVMMNTVVATGVITAVYLLDRFEKEPVIFLTKVYLASITTTWLFAELKWFLLGSKGFSLGRFGVAFIEAALLEESLKLGLFMALIWKSCHFDEKMDGIIYSAVIAAGFSVQENIGYTVRYSQPSFLYSILSGHVQGYARDFFYILIVRSIPGHILFDIPMGYCLARARFGKRSDRAFILGGFLLAVLFHGTWNLLPPSILLFRYLPFLMVISALFVFITGRVTEYGGLDRELRESIEGLVSESEKGSSGVDVWRRIIELRGNLRFLRNVPGDEQLRLASWIRSSLPIPLANYAREGPNGSIQRIRRINDELRKLRGQWDWMSVLFQSLAFLLPSILLLLILNLLL